MRREALLAVVLCGLLVAHEAQAVLAQPKGPPAQPVAAQPRHKGVARRLMQSLEESAVSAGINDNDDDPNEDNTSDPEPFVDSTLPFYDQAAKDQRTAHTRWLKRRRAELPHKVLMASLRWAMGGVAIGVLWEFDEKGPEEAMTYMQAGVLGVLGGALGGLLRFWRYQRQVTAHLQRGLALFKNQNEGVAAGVVPLQQSGGDREYRKLLEDGANDDPADELALAFPQASVPPVQCLYSRFVTYHPLAEPNGPFTTPWRARLFRRVRLLPALLVDLPASASVDDAWEGGDDRRVVGAYCEVDASGEMTGRVVGRGTATGDIWNGNRMVGKLEFVPFLVKLPAGSPGEAVRVITTHHQLTYPSWDRTKADLDAVVAGRTMPAGLTSSPSTFGVYYAENDEAIALHRSSVDWATHYHLSVVAKAALDLPSLVAAAVGPSDGHTCVLLQSMQRMAMCWVVVNLAWLTKTSGLRQPDFEGAMDDLLASVQLGFDARDGTGRLRMHVLVGTLTPEGTHPSVSAAWVSLKSLLVLHGCDTGPSDGVWSQPRCLGDGYQHRDGEPPSSRVACGRPATPLQDGGEWQYPMEAGTVADCQSPFVVGEDATAYLDLLKFTPLHRSHLKLVADQGEGWKEQAWEEREQQLGYFIGAVEQRSSRLDVRSWSDHDMRLQSVDG